MMATFLLRLAASAFWRSAGNLASVGLGYRALEHLQAADACEAAAAILEEGAS